MKIEYLKLINFIGIYNGLERYEIEIDFKETNSIITLLSGINGSGKTTILSCLHPFPSTLDNRDNIILDKKSGKKEIVYYDENTDIRYSINILYNRTSKETITTKCYIKENNTELNENGNVTSFIEIVKDKLHVSPEMFKLLRIGNNVITTIDLKPAERKKFISNFLPSIDEYLVKYEIINKEFTKIKNELKTLNMESQQYGNLSDIESNITNYEKIIDQSENRLTIIHQDLGKLEFEKKEITSKLDVKFYNSVVTRLKDINTEIEKNYNFDFSKVSSPQEMENKIKELDILIHTKKDDIRMSEYIVTNKTIEFQDLSNTINENNTWINDNKLEKNIAELESLLIQYELKDKEFKKLAKKYKNITFTLADYNLFISKLDAIKDMESTLSNYSMSDIAFFSEEHKSASYNFNISDKISRQELLKKRLEHTKKELNTDIANLKFKKILDERPSECKIDDCSFIKNVLQYSNLDKEIESKEKIHDNILSELNALDKEIETDKIRNEIQRYLKKFIQDIIKSKDILDNFINLSYDEYSLICFIFSDKDKYKISDNVLEYITMKEYAEIDTERYNSLILEKQLYDDKTKEIYKYKKALESDTLKQENVKAIIVKEKQNISSLSKELESLTEKKYKTELILRTVNEYNKIKEEQGNLQKIVNDNAVNVRLLKEINLKINSYKEELESLEKDKVYNTKELDKLKYKKNRIEELYIKIKDIESNFEKYESIKDALSPIKGIPLIFIDTYLEQTKFITNELLALTNSEFIINKFIINAKEFKISVQKKNGMQILDDITLASQGETALVKVALSLALLKQTLTNYKIVLLDEIDAELDHNNRRAFAEILVQQIKELDIPQCFMISHNNEFDLIDLNLILLEGTNLDIDNPSYIKNKKIIFDASR